MIWQIVVDVDTALVHVHDFNIGHVVLDLHTIIENTQNEATSNKKVF